MHTQSSLLANMSLACASNTNGHHTPWTCPLEGQEPGVVLVKPWPRLRSYCSYASSHQVVQRKPQHDINGHERLLEKSPISVDLGLKSPPWGSRNCASLILCMDFPTEINDRLIPLFSQQTLTERLLCIKHWVSACGFCVWINRSIESFSDLPRAKQLVSATALGLKPRAIRYLILCSFQKTTLLHCAWHRFS